MDEGLLTHADLARGAGVSVTSVKSYRAKFPGFIPVAAWTKPIRFRPEALPVCRRIRELFAEGRSPAQIRAILAREFPEQGDQRPAETPANPFAAGISERSFQEFFKAAGQMMQGMAALATAQARADQRLTRLERSLEGLAQTQAQGAEALDRLAGELRQWSRAASERPRKVVAVRGAGGSTATYAFEAQVQDAARPSDLPPPDLLALPVAIRSERGEYLGVAGRPSLEHFAQALERLAGSADAFWTRQGDGHVLALSLGGSPHGLRFEPVTTPSGVRVALLARLDLDGQQTSPAFIQEFMRQIRERMEKTGG